MAAAFNIDHVVAGIDRMLPRGAATLPPASLSLGTSRRIP